MASLVVGAAIRPGALIIVRARGCLLEERLDRLDHVLLERTAEQRRELGAPLVGVLAVVREDVLAAVRVELAVVAQVVLSNAAKSATRAATSRDPPAHASSLTGVALSAALPSLT
jgi:hypothetical protein